MLFSKVWLCNMVAEKSLHTCYFKQTKMKKVTFQLKLKLELNIWGRSDAVTAARHHLHPSKFTWDATPAVWAPCCRRLLGPTSPRRRPASAASPPGCPAVGGDVRPWAAEQTAREEPVSPCHVRSSGSRSAPSAGSTPPSAAPGFLDKQEHVDLLEQQINEAPHHIRDDQGNEQQIHFSSLLWRGGALGIQNKSGRIRRQGPWWLSFVNKTI